MSVSSNFYFGWILYDFLCGILILILSKRIVNTQKKLFLGCFFFSFLVLAVFGNAISPDYWNYVDLVKEIASTQDPFVHMEEFYIWLIHKIGNNFYLYQLCVYIPQFVLIYLIFTRGCHLDNPILFLLLFAILVLYSSIVGRNYLFTAVYLSALVLLANRKFVLGILLLAISVIFHKLAYIALPLSVLYFIPLRINRKTLTVLAILFISAIGGINYIINNYIFELVQGLGDVKGKDYLLLTEKHSSGNSFWWQAISNYQVCVKYLFAFISLYYLRRVVSLNIFSIDRMMYAIVFWSSLASLLFYSIDLPDTTIAGRTFMLGQIPLCYLFSKIPNCLCVKQWHKILFFFICIFYMMFSNAYIMGIRHSIIG